MPKSRWVLIGWWVCAVVLSGCVLVATTDVIPAQGAGHLSQVTVSLSAAQTTTSWDERDPERSEFELPVVYLHRERRAAAEGDRSLTLHLTGLPAAAEIQLQAVSLHEDVTTGHPHIITRHVVIPDRPCTTAQPCSLRWALDATNPSDLYYLRVLDAAGSTLWHDLARPAFVALDTWDVALDGYSVRVYYASLFPFSRGEIDSQSRLAPAGVTAFIEGGFLPIIAHTWHAQVEAWGFGQPLHPEWDTDKVIEIIITAPPFALFGGTGTYTASTTTSGRLIPERRIWWHSNNNSFQAYDTLENACKVVFAHEFFHLMQWNVLLGTGQPTQRWYNVFIEAQAAVASAVQYPEIELTRSHVPGKTSAYRQAAQRYLSNGLKASYRDFEADPDNLYDAALYWRFLYEVYQGTAVMRVALEEMVRHYSPDIVPALASVMDTTFARLDGPFRSFEESLEAFARANYGLRLKDGRCTSRDLSACAGGYFDPDWVYDAPPLAAELTFAGGPLSYGGAIPASYGTDLIEIDLDGTISGQALQLTLQGYGAHARYSVQVWRLAYGDLQLRQLTRGAANAQVRGAALGQSELRAVTPEPEATLLVTGDGLVVTLPPTDPSTWNRLALIITRLDADEATDPAGNYTITLASQ